MRNPYEEPLRPSYWLSWLRCALSLSLAALRPPSKGPPHRHRACGLGGRFRVGVRFRVVRPAFIGLILGFHWFVCVVMGFHGFCCVALLYVLHILHSIGFDRCLPRFNPRSRATNGRGDLDDADDDPGVLFICCMPRSGHVTLGFQFSPGTLWFYINVLGLLAKRKLEPLNINMTQATKKLRKTRAPQYAPSICTRTSNPTQEYIQKTEQN